MVFNFFDAKKRIIDLFLLLSFVFLGSQVAQAVPSFARQTGMSCSTCHTMFPELTPFGRVFKAGGYTMTTAPAISSKDKDNEEVLKLLSNLPLSVMGEFSHSRTNKTQPGTQNDNVEFPQELSLFIAGQISPNIGSFSQLTYSQQDGGVKVDNVDLRYAKNYGDWIFGATANNNPTVQDLWNTTPAWGFPYEGSESAPSPAAATQLEGALAQRVAGLGAYFFYNQTLYGEVSLYRSADQGKTSPPGSANDSTIQGVTPYWRLALQHSWAKQFAEIGTFGLVSNQYPTGISGATNRYVDIGFDAQFNQQFDKDLLVNRFTWIYEKQNLDGVLDPTAGTTGGSGSLNSLKLSSTYYIDSMVGLTLGYFNRFGSTNQNLYAPASLSGSVNGKPNSDGFMAEVDYQPWMNTKFSLQYTFYDKFNGLRSNYDGSGRSASQNNTLYALMWFAY